MFIMSVIFGLVALIGLAFGIFSRKPKDDDQYKARDRRTMRITGLTVGAIFGLIAIVFLIASMVYKIDEGEVGVEVLFGEITSSSTSPGLHFKNPLSAIVTYPTRTVESTYTGTEDEGEKAGNDAIEAFSAENALVSADLTVLWHVDPTKAGIVYKTVKDQYREVLIRPITRSAARDCIAMFEFDVARTTARAEVSECIRTNMEGQLADRGFVIESVQLRGMTADATLQASIEAKLQAANAVKEAEFRRNQAVVDKERAIIDAEAAAAAVVVAAEGEATRIIAVADAEAEANIVVAKSLTPDLLQLRIFEALSKSDSSLILMGEPGGVTPLLPLPTP